jgi:flavin reductase (DIM6/NTAB) family NADH-FMN oxidoreductase RutF
MAKKHFKAGDILAPLPAVMVSCGDKKVKNIITIAWTGIINSDPPMTYISVRKSRYSHDIIEKTGEFVINLTTEALAKKTDWAGVKSGRDVDKFKELELTPVKAKNLSCPMIKECPVNIECRVTEIRELGSHDMFMAEIVGLNIDEELIDEKGRFMFENAHLISYVHGEYYGLKSKPLGRFGYSVMKPKTKKRIAREKRDAVKKGGTKK